MCTIFGNFCKYNNFTISFSKMHPTGWRRVWLIIYYLEPHLHCSLHVLDETRVCWALSLHHYHHPQYCYCHQHQKLCQVTSKICREHQEGREHDKNPDIYCPPLHCLPEYQTCPRFLWGIHMLQPSHVS